MDISHQFFPLPIVAVPNIVINHPSVSEYNFESERRAIADYEKNKAALAVRREEVKSTSANSVSDEQTNIAVQRLPNVVSETQLRRVHSDVILVPSRVAAVFSQQQQSTKPVKPAVNAFEEFESKPNLFDLLELRTIDDKAALEQILTNAPPPSLPPASVSGTGAQSSVRQLPSASAPNTGLNMPGTEDVSRNLYNLPPALDSCNTSFGIGVSGASSFRQNL